ncbi:MAG: AMP-binding protein [bacterium]
MILNELLECNAVEYATSPALTMRMGYRTVSLNYKEVYDLACKIALFLQQQGIGKGDKVIIFAPNSPYWVCVFWGILLNGSIAIPVNVQSTSQMIDKIVIQTNSKLIFMGKYLKYNSKYDLGITSFIIDFIDELVEEFDPNNFKKIDLNQDDLIEILYTSGTTGDPKGVMLTHNNLISNVQSISTIIVLKPGVVRLLSILPLTHIFEQTIGLMLAFFYAAHIIYAHSYAAIGDLLREYRIDKMIAVPEFLKVFMQRIKFNAQSMGRLGFFESMLSISQKLDNKFISKILLYPVRRKIGSSLDTIATGGAPLEPELEREWRALGIDLIQGYGLTETSPVVCLNSFDSHRLGSVGKVLPGVNVRLEADGEILVKGPGVFQGYYKDEEKNRQVFTDDGWFRTGDMGYFDQDGFLFSKGRKKYMILGSGGQNVFPEDIELELNKITGVRDSCVLGIERGHGPVQIYAVLLLDPSVSDQEKNDPEKIIEQANSNLASYQLINSWSVWPEDDFPRSATRKVKRDDVKKILLAQMNGEKRQIVGDGKSRIICIISNISGVDPAKINLNTRIVRDLNMDSLMRVELVMRLELELGVTIDESKIGAQTTVQQLEELVEQSRGIKKAAGLKRWPRNIFVNCIRNLCQAFVFLISRIFMSVQVEGLENLEVGNLKELKNPVIFMPNHISYHDAIAVMIALPAKFRKKLALAAARDVLYAQYAKFSWLVELLFNSYPLSRLEDESIKLGLENTGKLIDLGYSIVVFPEGKISLDGSLQPLKLGAGFMAVEMDVAIVPIKIEGTDKIAPYGCAWPRKHAMVKVKIGKPIKFKKSDSYDMVKDCIEKAMNDL